MRTPITLISLAILAACGGGSGGGQAPIPDAALRSFNPAGPTINACESSYYREIAGVYSGQIQYASRSIADETACAWNVEIGIFGDDTGTTTRAVCDLKVSMTASSISGGEPCGEVGAAADLYDGLSASQNVGVWNSPPWPVDGLVVFTSDLPSGQVYPAGSDTGAVSSFEITLGGDGTIRLPESAAADSERNGVLVKQP